MILLIGLDGYDFDWAAQLQARGYAVAPLAAPVPLSWVAWNTLGTGLDAPAWGVTHDPNDYMQFGRRQYERPPYLWERLTEHELRAVIVNWPFVLTPKDPKGVLVCGYPALRDWFVRPARESDRWDYDELDLSNRWNLGRAGKVGEEVREQLRATPPREHLDACMASLECLLSRFVGEVARHEPRVAFLGMTDLDRLSHYAGAGMRDDAFLEELLNRLLGAVQILDRELRPETTLIFSDHGLDMHAQLEPGARQNVTHGVHVPGSQTGVLALKALGHTLGAGTAQQIDVVPMVLNRLGIDHELGGTDRSVPTGGSQDV